MSDSGEKDPLYAFSAHGVHLKDSGSSTGQAWGDCPFCGKAKKLAYGYEKEQWRCVVCEEKGNVYSFLKRVWEESLAATGEGDYERLAGDRGLLGPEALREWGLCKSFLTGEWLAPGFNHEGVLNNLYRYASPGKGEKKRMMGTPGLAQGMFGLCALTGGEAEVHYCEGVWDGVAYWETLRGCKEGSSGVTPTSSAKSCLLGRVGVVAVPGASGFGEKWGAAAQGKRMVLLYHNDHPGVNERTGQPIEAVGWAGMRRAAQAAARCPEKPESIHVLRWSGGNDPVEYDPELPSGFDLRDALRTAGDYAGRGAVVAQLWSMVAPMPGDWVEGRGREEKKRGGVNLKPVPCTTYKACVNEWTKAMKWSEGLDRFLSVALASAMSTRQKGDQLWVRGVSPPSTGKTTIAEAIAVAGEDFVKVVSEFTGLYSGYQVDAEGSEDLSLIAKINGKMLIIKEGNTLMSSPRRDLLMGQLRDLYDRTTRSSFKNKMGGEYATNCTNLICGTEAMRTEMDAAELGVRYLDCRIMHRIDIEDEKAVARMKARQAAREVRMSAVGEGGHHYSPELTRAMQTTGGYVRHLMTNATGLLSAVEETDRGIDFCVDCGLLVAYLRARPSKKHDEDTEREIAARLTSQFVRLGSCLAAVMNRPRDDDPLVLERVRQTALDTCWGKTAQIVEHLYQEGAGGMEMRVLAFKESLTDQKCRDLLRFLAQIRVVEKFQHATETPTGTATRTRYRLTAELTRLWESVVVSPPRRSDGRGRGR